MPGRRGSGRDGGRDRLTVFDDARLAGIYDALDPDRSDLGAYLAIVEEIGARSVLDLGCGTGVFALMLADRGLDVIGVDPAGASLEVARAKPGAELVTFESPNVFEADGTVITSRSTLRFRSRSALEASLQATGFGVVDVRDAPDRPGRELVFLARRAD